MEKQEGMYQYEAVQSPIALKARHEIENSLSSNMWGLTFDQTSLSSFDKEICMTKKYSGLWGTENLCPNNLEGARGETA